MSYSSGSHLRWESLFGAALEDYGKQTGMELANHPLTFQLERCDSVDAIMSVLQQQAHTFTEFRGEDGKVKKSLKRAVHILHALSASITLGEGVGLVRRMAFLTISSSQCSFYSYSRLQRRYFLALPSYSPYVFPSC
jgi:hypothetical protein